MSLYFILSANILSLILGFLLDTIIGDPRWSVHPVRLMGKAVLMGEGLFYGKKGSFTGGVLLLIFTVAVVAGPYLMVLVIAFKISPMLYIILSTLGVWTALSVKDMKVQVSLVADTLEKDDLPLARRSLALLVSRDTQKMEKSKIVSSAIETVGENFTDAVFSPVFYASLLGGFGAVLFKAVSTLDSMVGYKNDRYERFGTASARADDVLGFIPARLSVIPVMLGSVMAGVSPKSAWQTYLEYRKSHASPNSGHGIAAFAGALRVTLGGATSYGGVVYDKPEIKGGKEPLTAGKIRGAVRIYEDAAFFAVMMAALMLWLIVKTAALRGP